MSLAELEARIVECRRCPRLVEWRELVAREKRAAFRDQEYWGRPVPGFGDPAASVYVLGLAPAAHGANRTGRVFTGDRSGDWLFASMHRTGFANQPVATHPGDGLRLIDLWIGAAVRCAPPANKPTPEERENCLPYAREELALLEPGGDPVPGRVRLERRDGAPSRPAPGRGPASATAPSSARRTATVPSLLGSFHPSQQNTFTGKLTEEMTDSVLLRARELAGLDPP